MVTGILGFLFGSGRNVVKETAEVFMPNSEANDERLANIRNQAMSQFAQEFGRPGLVNQLADGMNRLGRPIITYGMIYLFVAAMYDPLWFAARMQGLTLIPEALWIIFGCIVSFFFGSRELSKYRSTSMAKEAARIAIAAPQVVQAIEELPFIEPGSAAAHEEPMQGENAALNEWKKYEGR